MSQHSLSIANEAGAAFRTDVNSGLQALASQSSGAAAPSTTYAYQRWADTTNAVMKRRNAANSGWVIDGTLAETFVLSRSSNTILGLGDVGRTIVATASFTQTLTAAATLGDGWWVAYRVESAASITFDPNAAEQIDGAATKAVTGPASGIIYCNGSAFYTVGFPTASATATQPRGRLSLTSATPVTTADVTAATTVYYTPYNGSTVPIYNGTSFVDTAFTELSQATTDATKSPAAVAASKVYDIFVWNDSGTMRATRGPAWSSDTSRGTGAGTSELQMVSGVWTNKVSITNGPGANLGTYVGTIRSDGSSQINDSVTLRHVWNAYNRVERPMAKTDTTDTWTYTTTTIRQANGSAANQVDYVCGLNEEPVTAMVIGNLVNSAANAMGVGIGVDSTTAYSSTIAGIWGSVTGATNNVGSIAKYRGFPGVGRHYIAWLEKGNVSGGTSTFAGDNATTDGSLQSGLVASIRG